MKHEELIKSPEYHLTMVQVKLFNKVYNYMENNNLTNEGMCEFLGISKNKLKTILSGDFNGKLSEFISILLKLDVYLNIDIIKPLK